MPEPRREHSKDVVADTAARIVNGPDPERVRFRSMNISCLLVVSPHSSEPQLMLLIYFCCSFTAHTP